MAKRHFAMRSGLKDDAVVAGTPIRQWNDALTGTFVESLPVATLDLSAELASSGEQWATPALHLKEGLIYTTFDGGTIRTIQHFPLVVGRTVALKRAVVEGGIVMVRVESDQSAAPIFEIEKKQTGKIGS